MPSPPVVMHFEWILILKVAVKEIKEGIDKAIINLCSTSTTTKEDVRKALSSTSAELQLFSTPEVLHEL